MRIGGVEFGGGGIEMGIGSMEMRVGGVEFGDGGIEMAIGGVERRIEVVENTHTLLLNVTCQHVLRKSMSKNFVALPCTFSSFYMFCLWIQLKQVIIFSPSDKNDCFILVSLPSRCS